MFGIDGDQQVTTENDDFPKNNLDEHWDNLLDDDHRGNTSGSFFQDSYFPRLDILALPDTYGIESIEVMTDVSQDYFNSSRVKMLATPERNLNRREMVSTRQKVEEPYEDDYEYYDTESSGNHNMAPELKAGSQHSTEHNSSFQSFGVNDISHISNADSETQRLPDSSFQDHRLTIDDAAFSPMLDVASPFKINDSSFASTPRRSPPRLDMTLKFPTTFGPFGKKGKLRPRRSQEKENFQPGVDLHHLTYSHNHRTTPKENNSRVSTTTVPKRKESTHQFGDRALSEISAIDSMPADFLQAIESARQDAPSPISQIGSNNGLEETSSAEQRRSEKSSFSSSSTPSLTGRLKYRTVVPRRVYMDSPSQFPEEHDSFSTPPLGAQEPHDAAQRSLLDSFEDAQHYSF
jgi:hypothetical protein